MKTIVTQSEKSLANRLYLIARESGDISEMDRLIAEHVESRAKVLVSLAKTVDTWIYKGIVKTLAPYENNELGLRLIARDGLAAYDSSIALLPLKQTEATAP